jgi:hypothetical protein
MFFFFLGCRRHVVFRAIPRKTTQIFFCNLTSKKSFLGLEPKNLNPRASSFNMVSIRELSFGAIKSYKIL